MGSYRHGCDFTVALVFAIWEPILLNQKCSLASVAEPSLHPPFQSPFLEMGQRDCRRFRVLDVALSFPFNLVGESRKILEVPEKAHGV